jgi:hypothetical protein
MEVESPSLLRLQPALHLCAFVGAVIVHDEMYFLIDRELRFQMVEEPYEFPTAVAILTSPDHFAVENIERGEQSGGAMAFIVVRLTLRQAGAQRQNGSSAIQSLNLTLLIHAQYQGTFGRIQIQANDVPDLFLKARIVGQFELLHTVWLHIVTLPDPVNDGSGNPQLSRQHPHTPVRAAVAGAGLYSGINDLLFQFRCQHAASTVAPANACNGS